MFQVEIARTLNVFALKKAIQAEKHAFQHVDTDALSVWKTSFPADGLS